MAQEFVEAGYEDGVPFVNVKEGLYPNVHFTTYRGDMIPKRFQKFVDELPAGEIVEKEEDDVVEESAPKKDSSDLLSSLL